MTKPKQKPGPWRRQVIAPHFTMTAIETGDGKFSIARVYNKDDARLIVEAPAMLDVLRNVAFDPITLNDNPVTILNRWRDQARVILARIYGEAE